jgi:hypothetical protein
MQMHMLAEQHHLEQEQTCSVNYSSTVTCAAAVVNNTRSHTPKHFIQL